MKKVDKSEDLRPEYRREDLGKGVRGKYLASYRSGTNLVLLSPEVAKAFQTEEAVNEALRSLMEIAKRSAGTKKNTTRRPQARN
jgi:hypothetical protein